jgi:hypothetical protein
MSAKDLVIKPIQSQVAKEFVRKTHYSGKVVQNSVLHLGVFWQNTLQGVMSFGSSLDKSKVISLVTDTGWNDFLELNRMAFSDKLPRNSESRAIAIAMKLIRKYKPNIKWVISFADACQCGDGTIYRASGFVLTGLKVNKQIYKLPLAHELDIQKCKGNGLNDIEIEKIKAWLNYIAPKTNAHVHKMSIEDRPAEQSVKRLPHAHKMSLQGRSRPDRYLSEVKMIMRRLTNGGTSASKFFKAIGGQPAIGYQLRYIYFIDKSYRSKLTVQEIPFSKIKEVGASMYKGQSV